MIFNKWDPCWKVCLSDNKGKEKERTSLLRLFKPYKRENLFEEVENLSQRTVVTADSDGFDDENNSYELLTISSESTPVGVKNDDIEGVTLPRTKENAPHSLEDLIFSRQENFQSSSDGDYFKEEKREYPNKGNTSKLKPGSNRKNNKKNSHCITKKWTPSLPNFFRRKNRAELNSTFSSRDNDNNTVHLNPAILEKMNATYENDVGSFDKDDIFDLAASFWKGSKEAIYDLSHDMSSKFNNHPATYLPSDLLNDGVNNNEKKSEIEFVSLTDPNPNPADPLNASFSHDATRNNPNSKLITKFYCNEEVLRAPNIFGKSNFQSQLKHQGSKKSNVVKKVLSGQDDWTKNLVFDPNETEEVESIGSDSSLCAQTDVPVVHDPLAKPSKRMKKALNKVSGDNDVWVEKILRNKKTGKQRSFFYSVKTGERQPDEPPTGASTVIFSYKEVYKPKIRIDKSRFEIRGDDDVWIERVQTDEKTNEQQSIFYSVNTGEYCMDEPPTGASKVIYSSHYDQ